jgi:diadenosine tetraphosphate (Ap4A) HIT family hydrolase
VCEEKKMPDTKTHEPAQTQSRPCQICRSRAEASEESVVFASELWTATLAADVPGWIMITLNRHTGDWLWGLTPEESSALGPLMQRLSEAARSEAGAERVYLMGFGENWQHFHFMLLSRPATVPDEFRGPGLLGKASELADRPQALRVGARIRKRLAATV